MDTKIDIKEEDGDSQNAGEFTTKDFVMKTSSDALLLDDNCDMEVKTEIKSESPFPDFSHHEKREPYTTLLFKKNKSESVASINRYEIDFKTFEKQTLNSSENKGELLSEDDVMSFKKYNIDNKIEIKEECCSMETDPAPVVGGNSDEDSSPVKSPRLHIEEASENADCRSLFPPSEHPGNNTSCYNGKSLADPETRERDLRRITSSEKDTHSEHSNGGIKGLYKCDFKCTHTSEICDRSFTQFSSLKLQAEKPHQCEICEKSFTHVSGLEEHKLVHIFEKSYKCEICEKGFTEASHLNKHMLIHSGQNLHKCKICGKCFLYLSLFKIHKLAHSDRNTHTCEICGKGFKSIYNVKRHLLIHSGEKLHSCELCGKRFGDKRDLKIHKFVHEDEKPHKCEVCEKSFALKSGLKTHKLIHTGEKSHKCELCERSFTQKSSLKKHKLIHTGEKSHKCELCAKSFSQRSSLKKHKYIHTGEKPHKCEICNKGFVQKSILEKHKLIHTREKSHKCEFCGKNHNWRVHAWMHTTVNPHKC